MRDKAENSVQFILSQLFFLKFAQVGAELQGSFNVKIHYLIQHII